MAKTTSAATGQTYGVKRVCQVWDAPRSSFYAAQAPKPANAEPQAPARRGPKPVIPDEALLAAIKHDLATSPWTGEGHRKVWARLRVRDGIRVSRKRVLRVMRQNALLSPHRARQKGDGALKAREVDPANAELAAAMRRIGELSMEVELLRAKMERSGPLSWRRSR